MKLGSRKHAMWRLAWLLAVLALALPPVISAELVIELVAPTPGVPLFDRVTVAWRLAGETAVEAVEVLVDGRSAGVVRQPPWELEIDVGSENREHRIEIVARGVGGEEARSRLVSPAIEVHETVELELQQLYLTVTDRDGFRVLDLPEAAISVRDDGRQQEIVTLAGGEIPFTAVLLVDGSGSMAGPPLAAALDGSRRFVAGMAENDEAKVLVTSDRVLRSSPWTDDPVLLASSLGQTRAMGGSAILDHLFLALQLLEERQGRRVVVLLSDGWDLHSALSAEQLRKVARRSQAVIYWVRLGEQGPGPRGPSRHAHSWVNTDTDVQATVAVPLSAWRDREGWQRIVDVLEAVVDDSGGRIVPITRVGQIETAFADILGELREQVAVGYYPEPERGDGSWREVKVRLARRGLNVRTRKGYIDRE